MSLRTQIAVWLLALSLLFVAVTYSVQALVILPAFERLERQSATQNVARCVDALEADISSLANTANDWGAWDDMYQFVEDHNEQFAKGNLIGESFSNTKLNLICIVDSDRKIVWGESRDFETLELFNVPDVFEMLLASDSPFLGFTDPDQKLTGVALTSRGPIMIVSRPILNTKHEGPVRGSLIMGRFLNDMAIANLSERTHIPLQITVLPEQLRQGPVTETADQNTPPFPIAIEEKSENELTGQTILADVYGRPAIELAITHKRTVKAQGSISAGIATTCSLVGGLFTLVAMWFVLSYRIVGPLQAMANHAVGIGANDNLKARLASKRTDEIGTLSNELDRMVKSLSDARKKVLNSAHRAGMSEIAAEVLHNVGNAVNSANCSAEVIEAKLTSSKISGLDKAVVILRENSNRVADFFSNDPRAPKLVEYLIYLNDALQDEREKNLSELSRLKETIHHIRDAVTSQSLHADGSSFIQEVSLAEICEEAIRLNRHDLSELNVKVDSIIPPLPDLQLNKSQLTQVLVNLIKNAGYALRTQQHDNRHLTLRANVTDDGELELEIMDNGAGFDEAVQARLFSHRFTTKPEGSGLGLHYCANVIRNAGGQITASSCGPNLGAKFSIKIPKVLPETELVR